MLRRSRRKASVAVGLPTGVVPDAVTEGHLVLIKSCSRLRLTHQIRLATFMAMSEQKRLLLVIRTDCVLEPALGAFLADNRQHIEVKRG